jgi:hypothetical protein
MTGAARMPLEPCIPTANAFQEVSTYTAVNPVDGACP